MLTEITKEWDHHVFYKVGVIFLKILLKVNINLQQYLNIYCY